MSKKDKERGFSIIPGKWYDANVKPPDYDLVILKDSSEKTQMGWWSGQSWDGARIHFLKDVKQWKKTNILSEKGMSNGRNS